MKYGTEDTSKHKQTKQEGHTTKPAYSRYFTLKKWIVNKKRKIAKAEKQRNK
jgi:hypothetical protein